MRALKGLNFCLAFNVERRFGIIMRTVTDCMFV